MELEKEMGLNCERWKSHSSLYCKLVTHSSLNFELVTHSSLNCELVTLSSLHWVSWLNKHFILWLISA